ncbi:MAG: restriction endonuclease subunit S [Rhodocyclaceae bacterium]
MKAGWQSKPFEDCIEKVTYTTKVQRKDFLDVGAYPVVSQEEAFINGYWDNEDDLFRVANPVVVFGDHTKVLKYIDFDFVLGADGVKLIPPKEFLVPKFFYYQLQTAQLDSLGYARHYKLLKELEIKYPDRVEQHRIVAILDEAFDGIATAKANAEQNLQNARALFESHLQKVFTERGDGWVDLPLATVCELINGRAYKKHEMLATGKYQLLRVGNFFTNRDWYYSDLELEPDKYCDNGDLLYAWSASFGPRIWEGGKVIYHYHIWKVLPNEEEIKKRFLLYLFEWDVEQIKKAYGAGTTMLHVSKGSMERRVLPIPPLSIQDKIVSLLDDLTAETRRLESLYQQKLAALDELKKSLLHQAFTGKLTEHTVREAMA